MPLDTRKTFLELLAEYHTEVARLAVAKAATLGDDLNKQLVMFAEEHRLQAEAARNLILWRKP